MGVPAALAWGMEGTTLEDQSDWDLSVAAGRSTAAYEQQDDTQEQHCNDHWSAPTRYFKGPNIIPNENEVWRKALLESVDRGIHCGSTGGSG